MSEDQKRALAAMPEKRLCGSERLTFNGDKLSLTVSDFWQWSVSDLVSNLTRGRLAEFIVAHALGIDVLARVRNEWDAFDLITSEEVKVKVEVKSSAYLQSWFQKGHSPISWSVGPTRAWSHERGESDREARLHAEVYVLALLCEKDKDKVDPLKVDQWEFFVVPKTVVEARPGVFTPRLLEARGIYAIAFHGLRAAVLAAAGKTGPLHSQGVELAC
jgi:hypothetical protein